MVLKKARLPKSNLSKKEFQALKALNNDPGVVVLKADKGGVAVILDKNDYQRKMLDHLLNSGRYRKLNKNPIKKSRMRLLMLLILVISLAP